jgi:hypothetical protein
MKIVIAISTVSGLYEGFSPSRIYQEDIAIYQSILPCSMRLTTLIYFTDVAIQPCRLIKTRRYVRARFLWICYPCRHAVAGELGSEFGFSATVRRLPLALSTTASLTTWNGGLAVEAFGACIACEEERCVG